jgi:hypothetical protein
MLQEREIHGIGEMGIGRSTRDEHNDKFTGSAKWELVEAPETNAAQEESVRPVRWDLVAAPGTNAVNFDRQTRTHGNRAI